MIQVCWSGAAGLVGGDMVVSRAAEVVWAAPRRGSARARRRAVTMANQAHTGLGVQR
jgi:hypothetical protein